MAERISVRALREQGLAADHNDLEFYAVEPDEFEALLAVAEAADKLDETLHGDRDPVSVNRAWDVLHAALDRFDFDA